MSGMQEVVQFLERKFNRQIKARHVLPASGGEFADFPGSLDPRLGAVLREQGIGKLYSHQAEAFAAIAANRDTVLVSRTASGKTLSFLLPILNEYMQASSPFGVLLLYPTKALSRDQESTLGRLMHAAMDDRKLGTFDGDTPREERRNIQRIGGFRDHQSGHAARRDPAQPQPGVEEFPGAPALHRGGRGPHVPRRVRVARVERVPPAAAGLRDPRQPAGLRVLFGHGRQSRRACGGAVPPAVPGDRAGDGAPRPRRDLYFVNPAAGAEPRGPRCTARAPGRCSSP